MSDKDKKDRAQDKPEAQKQWYVYIILSSDDRYYTGITTDVDRRWQEHLSSNKGAKFFRGRYPKEIVYVEEGHDRSTASKREAAIKSLKREEKIALLCSDLNTKKESQQ